MASSDTNTVPISERELSLTRFIPADRTKVFKAWTDPQLLVQWFTPPPYLTTHAELDVRAGGSSFVMMRSPEGVDIPNHGVYLEVIENEKLVITDAYIKAWEPSEKPFVTICLTFENEDGGTRYTARVLQWTAADREAHESMGFHEGWGIATDQLTALVTGM